MKNIYFIVLSMIMLCSCSQTGPGYGEKEGFEGVKGVIAKKGWSKSGESYCAQGSDYYVIKIKDSGSEDMLDSYVVDTENFPKSLNIDDYVGKTVECRGEVVEKSWEINYDDGGQHPARPVRMTEDGEVVEEEGPVTHSCLIFRISEIKGAN